MGEQGFQVGIALDGSAAGPGLGPVDGPARFGRPDGFDSVPCRMLAGRDIIVSRVILRPRVRVVDPIGGNVGGVFPGFDRGLDLALLALQQRIALQLALDIGLELKIRQLQQLDRLLQLRRDDQSLALPNLETRAERQSRPLACFLLPTLARQGKLIG